MTLNEKQAHFSAMFAKLVLHAAELGYAAVIDMVARTPEEQARLVATGKSRTRNSKHVQRLAGDLLLFKDGHYLTRAEDYAALGAYWCSLDQHNVWGGSWKGFVDADHFEFNG